MAMRNFSPTIRSGFRRNADFRKVAKARRAENAVTEHVCSRSLSRNGPHSRARTSERSSSMSGLFMFVIGQLCPKKYKVEEWVLLFPRISHVPQSSVATPSVYLNKSNGYKNAFL